MKRETRKAWECSTQETMMFNEVTKKSIQWGEETLTLETGKVARQADGTVIATLGETSVMANVTFAKEA
jgi:polyribonucleotide nucleotidyltransferase